MTRWTDEMSPPDFETPSGLTFENDDPDRSDVVAAWCIIAVVAMCIAAVAWLAWRALQ